jgi:ribosomal protein L25 (general stress protein Ctc)
MVERDYTVDIQSTAPVEIELHNSTNSKNSARLKKDAVVHPVVDGKEDEVIIEQPEQHE